MSRTRHVPSGLVVAVLLGSLAGCGRPAASSDFVAPHPASGAADAPLPGDSIYALQLQLTDTHGRTLRLAELRGQTMVAAMMYTSCDEVCPRVAEDMKSIERALGPRDKQGVTFVLFSLDPGRDTPAALTRFAADHALDAQRWRLFATAADGVRELAAVLGVRYRQADGGDIAHSAMIFVIDRDGVVRHRQAGLSGTHDELVDALARARAA